MPTLPITSGARDSSDSSGWEWDRLEAGHAAPQPSGSKPQPHRPKPLSGITAEGTPVPYAAVVKSPPHAQEKELEEEVLEYDVREEEEEVAPLIFPSLNNPAPESSSSSGHYSSGSSLSRPHSRASSTSSSNPSYHSGNMPKKSPSVVRKNSFTASSSNLAPFSVNRTGTPPLSGPSGGGKRAPTPSQLVGRAGTPGSASSASSPSLSGSAPIPSSPSFSSTFQDRGSTLVSAQTQVASLRGALEASRLREAKHKEEVEKVTKERDALQWENAAWRRRETEVCILVWYR